jgi:hypothetical protein
MKKLDLIGQGILIKLSIPINYINPYLKVNLKPGGKIHYVLFYNYLSLLFYLKISALA